MKKKNIIHIETNPLKRNEMHFQVQLTTRAHQVKPKKGKGSFKRNKKVREDE